MIQFVVTLDDKQAFTLTVMK